MELLGLIHALVLGLALGRPFVLESDSQGAVRRFLGSKAPRTPLERGARALLEVAKEQGLLVELRHLPREDNGEAHDLAGRGRKRLEGADLVEAFLLQLPLAYRASAFRHLRWLASQGRASLTRRLASPRSETERILAQLAREDPPVFEEVLEAVRRLSWGEAERREAELLEASMEGLPPTPRQAAFLKRHGVDPSGLTRAEASRRIQALLGKTRTKD